MPKLIKASSTTLGKDLSSKGVDKRITDVIESHKKTGGTISSMKDLETLGLSKSDILTVTPLITFTPEKHEPKMVDATIVTDLQGITGYTLLVSHKNKDGKGSTTISQSISITDNTVISYDANNLSTDPEKKEALFDVSVKAPNGKIVEIEHEGTKGQILTVLHKNIDGYHIKISRIHPVISASRVIAPSRLKGKLIAASPAINVEEVQIIFEIAVKKDESGAFDYYPVGYAQTEQDGYFFSNQLVYASETDATSVMSARAKVGIPDTDPISIQLQNVDATTQLGNLPEKVILYVGDESDTTSSSTSTCCTTGCDDCPGLNFLDKKVLDEFSFYSVVRTTEPLIESYVVDDVDEIDLGDIPSDEKVSGFLKGKMLPTSIVKDYVSKNGGISGDNYKGLLKVAETFAQLQVLNKGLDFGFGKEAKGRVNLDGNTAIDWDEKPTIFQAVSIAHGHLLHFKQEWFNAGYTIGDLLYSLPLAPGQKKQVVVFDWDRKDSAARTERLDYQDSLYNSLSRDRDVNEVARAMLTEHMEGESSATTAGGGIGVGVAIGPVLIGGGGGVGHSSSSASQDSSRSSVASSMQHITDNTVQAASSLRSQRSTVIQTASQGERFEAAAEVVANYNHCHALTIQYFEVLRHFEIRTRLVGVRECLFVPLKITPFDRKKALRWRDSLSKRLRSRQLIRGFDALARIDEEMQSATENYYDQLGIPKNRYAEETIEYVEGELFLEFQISRPANDAADEFILENWNLFGGIFGDPLEFYNRYVRNEKEKDEAFAKHAGPHIAEAVLNELRIYAVKNDSPISAKRLPIDATLLTTFKNKKQLNISLRMGSTMVGVAREDIDFIKISLNNSGSGSNILRDLENGNYLKIIVHSGSMRYKTKSLHEYLFKDAYIKNDLTLDGDKVIVFTPLSARAMTKPRFEDVELSNALLHHLNMHIEYYHQAIWLDMSPHRRFMLLDGLKAPGKAEGRSVASVVENKLIGVAGNSLIFPVAAGFQIDPTMDESVDLFEHYYENPQDPIHITLPTKGVYAEAVIGKCNSCEKKEDSRFWRWEESPIPDSPTAINAVTPPSPQNVPATGLEAKDFPQPIINLQNAPVLPDPQGYGGLVSLVGKGDAFRDITGLTENQRNALAALQSSLSTAQAFGNQAAALAPLMAKQKALEDIKKSGLPTDVQNDLLKQGYESLLGTSGSSIGQTTQDLARVKQMVDEGKISPTVGAAIEQSLAKKVGAEVDNAAAPINKSTVEKALSTGKDVKVQTTSPEGTVNSIEITGQSSSAVLADAGFVPAIKQENSNACWATTATMMMSWKMNESLPVRDVVALAGDAYLSLFDNAQTLLANDKAAFIGALGMVAEPNANYTISQYIDWLQTYGPLWITTDAQDASTAFSPHARVLKRIEGSASLQSDQVKFIFNDPATGTEQTETFTQFVAAYEQMITDNAGGLFIQIVHFKEGRAYGEGADPTPETNEAKVARLKSEGTLDFAAKKTYLEYITGLGLTDALKSIATLHGLTKGREAILDLMNRTTTDATEQSTLKTLDDKGALKRLKVIYDDDMPSDLDTTERTDVATFFSNRMQEKRSDIQTAYTASGIYDRFTLQSFPKTATVLSNAKKIINYCVDYGIGNKKRIAYVLSTANGESGFKSIMESNMSDTFVYSQSSANYYYSNKGGKQPYNKTTGIFSGQTQLSDYLIGKLSGDGYIFVEDGANRTFKIGANIDEANFNTLKTLLTSTMSTKESDGWHDKVKTQEEASDMFTTIKSVKNQAGAQIITDDILKQADFYRYAGKGFIQTTGKANYKKIVDDIKLDVPTFSADLENEPEKLLNAENAVYALVLGLKHGTYSGTKINDTLTSSSDTAWNNARTLVNGHDHDDEFAQCAKVYYDIVFCGRA